MNAPFTALDITVFLIILLSGFLAMVRGFTREVFSILSWLGALGAAVFAYLNKDIQDQVRNLVQPNWLADAVLVGATFIIVLIVISFITVRLTDFILDSRVGLIDRILGLIFGVARGLVLVTVTYLFFAWLVPTKQQPNWIQNAQSLPYMEQARNIFLSRLPENPSDLLDQLPGKLRNFGDQESGKSTPDHMAPEIELNPTGEQQSFLLYVPDITQRDTVIFWQIRSGVLTG